MTLGEKITTLRHQQEMSHGDLAEKMNVSRQSISKWETDTSIPELDKLIQLSEISILHCMCWLNAGPFWKR